jgi:WD40 repeat protein
VGYKNSQFQIVSTVENLRVDFLKGDNLLRSEVVSLEYPIILTGLNITGKIIAKCNFEGQEFNQEIEIRDAIRLGSSEFKRAFLFEDTNFSFFLMKDRLLLYDEKRQIILTENHYSPTEIHQLNKTEFLFITRVGDSQDGIVNLGVYNTVSFSLVGELLNNYREVKIIPESNTVWLYNFNGNVIECFQIVNSEGRYFTQLKFLKGYENYLICQDESTLILKYPNELLFVDFLNQHRQFSKELKSNNAIDKFGNIVTLFENNISCHNSLTNYSQKIKLAFKINLVSNHFLHIGDEFTLEQEKIDFQEQIDEQYNHIIPSISTNNNEFTYNIKTEDRKVDLHLQHDIYFTSSGVYIIEKASLNSLVGIKYQLINGVWLKKSLEKMDIKYSVKFLDNENEIVLTEKNPSLIIDTYQFPMLLLRLVDKKVLLYDSKSLNIPDEKRVDVFSIEGIPYFSLQKKEHFSLYRATDFKQALLDKVKLLNPLFFREHKNIWFIGNERINSEANRLNSFDLVKCCRIPIDGLNIYSASYNHLSKYQFQQGFAISNDQIIFNPRNAKVKSAVVGKLEGHSINLNKILSNRDNSFLISFFNNKTLHYEHIEIPINSEKFKESYMSPDGRFLVLQEKKNTYCYYDIERNERINFVSGNFLAFTNDGSLIMENEKKSIKIIDPKTFQEVTSPNYRHYRFLSPDGKLYAQISTKTRYMHRLKEIEIPVSQLKLIRFFIDMPKNISNQDEIEKEKLKVERNRKELFDKFRSRCLELKILSPEQINSEKIIRKERFIEIGIVGTDVIAEIPVPGDLEYYNHASFSYDNKYFGFVGKPTFNGLIHLYQLAFDESKATLKTNNSYLTRLPKRASWVCGFSKTGYFATYDSIPDTYLIYVDDSLFENKLFEFDLRNKLKQKKVNLYHSFKNWNVIEKKNFLSFSSSGEFLALSEQGYDPLTLEGHGHQESHVVHIAKTESGEIFNSFSGHGDSISYNKIKNVVFVAFSEDEKKIMTLSSDGVVFIRNISLSLND